MVYTFFAKAEIVQNPWLWRKTLMFLFGYNHKYKEPDNSELLEWGERVFQLISLILGSDREKAQELTIKVLNLWNQDILKEKKRAGKTRLYTQNPTDILKNRYHLLQTSVFYNLQQEEILQEEKFKLENDSAGAQIHAWTLILRYVKYVLKRTNKISESRLVGMCRILRHYKLDDLQDIFARLIPGESSHHSTHFTNLQSKLFGDNEDNLEPRQNRLRERFEPFAEIDDPRNITTIFKTLDKEHPAVKWIEEQLEDLLSPWGAHPTPPEHKNHQSNISAENYLHTLGIKHIRTATDYCAADELRMLLVTSPHFFEEFIVNSLHAAGEKASTKQTFRELQLPLMKNNTDDIPQSSPPTVTAWSAEEKLAALLSFSDSIKARKSGWLAESLCLRVNDELIKVEQITNTTEFEATITPVELIDFYMRENSRDILLYQFKIDFDELSESKDFEDNFTAEGGQTLSLQLNPEFQEGHLTKYNLTVKYTEPWFWKYRRAWLNQGFSNSLFRFPLVGIGLVIILFLFIFFIGNLQQNNESPIVVVEPSPAVSPDEAPIGNVGNKQRNNVDDELVANNNSSIQNSFNKKIERKNANVENQPKERKQNSPVKEKVLPPTRPEVVEKFTNPDEKLAMSMFGNPSQISKEEGIVDQSVTSRSGTSSAKGYFVSPDGVYVRPNNINLSWSAVPGAVRYIIEVRNSAGKLIVSPLNIFSTSAILTNLSPGDNYFWKIIPVNSNNIALPGMPEGNFSTLPSDALERISVAEKQFANSPLLLGIVYMKNGLPDEAIDRFNEYAAKNPKSQFIRQLLIRAKALRAK
jgi:hypothetical protein